MRRKKLIWQLFPPFLFITFISLLATTVYVTKFWRQIYLEQLSANLLKLTLLAESQLKPLLVGKDFSQINEVVKF
jgi:two-component system phosphate regulon sensor histidine kinase PhoR